MLCKITVFQGLQPADITGLLSYMCLTGAVPRRNPIWKGAFGLAIAMSRDGCDTVGANRFLTCVSHVQRCSNGNGEEAVCVTDGGAADVSS